MTVKLTKSGWSVCVAAVSALAGLVFYLITSVTGFLSGTAMSPLPIVCTVAAILLALVLVCAAKTLSPLATDFFVVAAALLLIAAFALFAMGRVTLVADVYFIPVNYPQAEASALNLSIAGRALYLVAIAAMIITAFSEKITKD